MLNSLERRDFEQYLHRLLRILVQVHSHLRHHEADRILRRDHDPMALTQARANQRVCNHLAHVGISLQLREAQEVALTRRSHARSPAWRRAVTRRWAVIVTAVMRSWAAALSAGISQRDSTSSALVSVRLSAFINPCFVHLEMQATCRSD